MLCSGLQGRKRSHESQVSGAAGSALEISFRKLAGKEGGLAPALSVEWH